MFVKKAGLKRLLGSEYKGKGIKVARKENRYYIAGSYWTIMVPDAYLKKEIRALVIELVNKMPEEGECFLYADKCEPQATMLETVAEDIWTKWNKCQERRTAAVAHTRVRVETDQNTLHMWQRTNGKKLWLPGTFVDIIGEPVETETMSLPMADDSYVYFSGNEMAMKCLIHQPRFVGEQLVLDSLSGKDMMWPQTEDETIC